MGLIRYHYGFGQKAVAGPGGGLTIQAEAVRDDGLAGPALARLMLPMIEGHWDASRLDEISLWDMRSSLEVAANIRTTGLPYSDNTAKVLNGLVALTWNTAAERIPIEVRFGAPRSLVDPTWVDFEAVRSLTEPWFVGYPRQMVISTDSNYLVQCTGVFLDPCPTEAEWRALGGRYVIDIDRLLGWGEWWWSDIFPFGAIGLNPRPFMKIHIGNTDWGGASLATATGDYANWRWVVGGTGTGTYRYNHYDRAATYCRIYQTTGDEKWLRRGLVHAHHNRAERWAKDLATSSPPNPRYDITQTENFTNPTDGWFMSAMLTNEVEMLAAIGLLAQGTDYVRWMGTNREKFAEKNQWTSDPRPMGQILLIFLHAHLIGDTSRDWATLLNDSIGWTITRSANDKGDGTWRSNNVASTCPRDPVLDINNFWQSQMHWFPVRALRRCQQFGFTHPGLVARALAWANKVFPAHWQFATIDSPKTFVFRNTFSGVCDSDNAPFKQGHIDLTNLACGSMAWFHEIDPNGGWDVIGEDVFQNGVGINSAGDMGNNGSPFLVQSSGQTYNEQYWDKFRWVHDKVHGFV